MQDSIKKPSSQDGLVKLFTPVDYRFCSGFGQYHTNEFDPQKPEKKLTPYIQTSYSELMALVDDPQQIDKRKAQWIIPSSHLSRTFKAQELHGSYLLLWADIDKGSPEIEQVQTVLNQMGHFNYEIYTTSSATLENLKYRILIFLAVPLTSSDWITCQKILNDGLEHGGLIVDRKSEGFAQLCYLPNRGEYYETCSKRETGFLNPLVDWSNEIAQEALERLKIEAEIIVKRQSAKIERDLIKSSPETTCVDLIGEFNNQYPVEEILLLAGYAQRGSTFRHPLSESGSYSASVKDGRVFTLSSSDRLYSTEGAHDSFSVFTTLFHDGDIDKALKEAGDQWLTIDGISFNLFNQRLYMAKKEREESLIALKAANEANPLQKEDLRSQPEMMPISIEAFPGVMADVVHATLRSAYKKQPELSILATLLGMSAACHGHYRNSRGVRMNLFGVGIAGTGEGKDAPRMAAIELARKAGAKVIGKAATGQGLEDAMEDYLSMLSEVDEIAHLIECMNSKDRNSNTTELAANLLKLFSASKSVYNTRVKAKPTSSSTPGKSIEHPCLNLLGFATPEKLGEALIQGNAEDGLLGRMLFAQGNNNAKPERRPQRFALPPAVITRCGEIDRQRKAINDSLECITQIELTDEADERFWQVTLEFDDFATNHRLDPISKQVQMRSAEKVERIAGVLAIWDNPSSPCVTVCHVNWAYHFVKYSNDVLGKFLSSRMFNSQTEANANKVLSVFFKILTGELAPSNASQLKLIKSGKVPHSALLRHSHIERQEFYGAIEYLVNTEQINSSTSASTNQRGATHSKTWYWIEKGSANE